MNRWPAIRESYLAWLRGTKWLTRIGQPDEAPEVTKEADKPVYLDVAFWSARTHEIEALARGWLADPDIDVIFDQVAAVMDEDLGRFDPVIAYFARFLLDGDPDRIAAEREMAHSVKRDLAWIAVERVVGHAGFFSRLVPWYARGRWPCGWNGEYPSGHLLVL